MNQNNSGDGEERPRQRMAGFIHLLNAAYRQGARAKTWIFAQTEHDGKVILLIVLLALALRVPFLNYPDRTVFDEVIYTNFTIHTIQHVPFFDIHPPLARMLFAEVARHASFQFTTLPMETNQSFGDFPYIVLRLFIAFFGVLLVLLVYGAGRLLSYAPRVAAIPALFVVFDNAFVIYSRAILPDTILLCFGLSGFIAAFAATTKRAGWKRNVLVLLAGIFLGLAASIKWTALGFFGTVILLFFLARMYWEIVASAIIVAAIYLSVFTSFLFYFPQGGSADPMLYPYNVPAVTQLEFPKNPREQTPQALVNFLATYHRVMLIATNDPGIAKKTLQAPGPLAWPAAKSSISFWENVKKNKHIVLTGNLLLWIVTFFALIFELLWIAAHFARKRRPPIDRAELILLAGYALNYIPFFFIHRPMFLYHYFTALLFLFLLLPRIAPRIIDCIARVSHDRLLANALALFVGLLIFLDFFLLTPTTYGF